MSRIGKNPIEIPSGVDVTVDGQNVRVKGCLLYTSPSPRD